MHKNNSSNDPSESLMNAIVIKIQFGLELNKPSWSLVMYILHKHFSYMHTYYCFKMKRSNIFKLCFIRYKDLYFMGKTYYAVLFWHVRN